jgi:hypothetical protein
MSHPKPDQVGMHALTHGQGEACCQVTRIAPQSLGAADSQRVVCVVRDVFTPDSSSRTDFPGVSQEGPAGAGLSSGPEEAVQRKAPFHEAEDLDPL